MILCQFELVSSKFSSQVPYSYCPTTEARNAFRRFSGSNPERWDYKLAGIPAPLTEEDEERQREKKRKQREKKREKDREKKAAEKEVKEQVCMFINLSRVQGDTSRR